MLLEESEVVMRELQTYRHDVHKPVSLNILLKPNQDLDVGDVGTENAYILLEQWAIIFDPE